MKKWLFLMMLWLVGCSAQQVPYSPDPLSLTQSPTTVIEQVVMEQPHKYRPSSVLVTDDYLAFDEGIVSKTAGSSAMTVSGSIAIGGISTRTKSTPLSTRLYFNSLAQPTLYSKRDWYIVQLNDKNGTILKRVYTRDKHKAEALIDAITLKISLAVSLK